MKYLLIVMAVLILNSNAPCQTNDLQGTNESGVWSMKAEDDGRISNAISLGPSYDGLKFNILSAEYERLVTSGFGFNIMLSFASAGIGMNYHLRPNVNSSLISFNYTVGLEGVGYHGSKYNLLSVAFRYRAPKYFYSNIGLGYATRNLYELQDKNKVRVTAGIGTYIGF